METGSHLTASSANQPNLTKHRLKTSKNVRTCADAIGVVLSLGECDGPQQRGRPGDELLARRLLHQPTLMFNSFTTPPQ